MKILAKTTPAIEPKTKDVTRATYLYVAILVLMVLAQLFTFDEFLVLLEDMMLPGGAPIAHLVGGLLVACEVLALPFLLRMRLSPLMRVVSMVLGWLVPLAWFKLSVWSLASGMPTDNIGFFGTVIKFASGWAALLLSVALGILAAWTSWGMWPIKTKKSHK